MSRIWAASVPDEPEGIDRVWDSEGDEWRKDHEGYWRLVHQAGSLRYLWKEIVTTYGPLSDQPKD